MRPRRTDHEDDQELTRLSDQGRGMAVIVPAMVVFPVAGKDVRQLASIDDSRAFRPRAILFPARAQRRAHSNGRSLDAAPAATAGHRVGCGFGTCGRGGPTGRSGDGGSWPRPDGAASQTEFRGSLGEIDTVVTLRVEKVCVPCRGSCRGRRMWSPIHHGRRR